MDQIGQNYNNKKLPTTMQIFKLAILAASCAALELSSLAKSSGDKDDKELPGAEFLGDHKDADGGDIWCWESYGKVACYNSDYQKLDLATCALDKESNVMTCAKPEARKELARD